jgi:hypothetical protein
MSKWTCHHKPIQNKNGGEAKMSSNTLPFYLSREMLNFMVKEVVKMKDIKSVTMLEGKK